MRNLSSDIASTDQVDKLIEENSKNAKDISSLKTAIAVVFGANVLFTLCLCLIHWW